MQDGVHTLRQHLHVHVLVLHLVWVHDEDGLSVGPDKSQCLIQDNTARFSEMDTVEYNQERNEDRAHTRTDTQHNQQNTHTHITHTHTHTKHLSVHSLDVLCHHEFVQANLFPFGNAARPRHHLSAHRKSKYSYTSHTPVAARLACMHILCMHMMLNVGMQCEST